MTGRRSRQMVWGPSRSQNPRSRSSSSTAACSLPGAMKTTGALRPARTGAAARSLHQPEPAKTDTARWEALLKLRQRRLTTLKQSELPWWPIECSRCRLRLSASLLPARRCPAFSIFRQATSWFRRAATRPLDPLIYDRASPRPSGDLTTLGGVHSARQAEARALCPACARRLRTGRPCRRQSRTGRPAPLLTLSFDSPRT